MHPTLLMLGWLSYAYAFALGGPFPRLFAPLIIYGYLGGVLFTLPHSIFTSAAAIVAWRRYRRGSGRVAAPLSAAVANAGASLLWPIAIFGFGWVLTA